MQEVVAVAPNRSYCSLWPSEVVKMPPWVFGLCVYAVLSCVPVSGRE
jgi:hypothetical protein